MTDHYLDQLQRKPGAYANCKVIRATTFEPQLLQMKERLAARHAPTEANRQFINILLQARKTNPETFINAIALALEYNAIEQSAVGNFIRQLDTPQKRPDEKQMRQSLKISTYNWEYNLAPYQALCQGGAK